MHGRRTVEIAAASVALFGLGLGPAIAAAPSLVIFGAYFPAWLYCALIGVVGAVVVRALMARLGLDEFLPAKLLVYLAFAILIGIGVWRFWYAGGPA